eukprot:CAMPEP_0206433268 /NCGR_PEP_ID=MMETSP0324_2-20121206/8432_1 /ASSEMBLY_ACC=CAM_ASM_000836 /TAXON_ID=2866 /ORGANISM="Crypthecodinium cohnii, Strain Seligo" /LENGTH=503 /DNA_ID=CAMNT_0053899501 /DNA_START=486 /DNA_END=1997 /DNA_ORIENTATION=-
MARRTSWHARTGPLAKAIVLVPLLDLLVSGAGTEPSCADGGPSSEARCEEEPFALLQSKLKTIAPVSDLALLQSSFRKQGGVATVTLDSTDIMEESEEDKQKPDDKLSKADLLSGRSYSPVPPILASHDVAQTPTAAAANSSEPLQHEPSAHVRTKHSWRRDMFDAGTSHQDPRPGDFQDGDEGLRFFLSASVSQWSTLGGFSLACFLTDLFLVQRLPNTWQTHFFSILFWVATAVAFNTWIFLTMGEEAGVEWCSGYFLEWTLSIDNLFVFHLIFKRYSVPRNQQHYAVFVGIMGAMVLRMIFFMIFSTLLHMFKWIRFVFGLLLVYSGIDSTMHSEDELLDPKETAIIRGLRFCLGDRMFDGYSEEGGLFRFNKDGQIQATVLLVVVVCLEVTDVLFAVDSVSVKVAQIPSQFLAFSSTLIAMFALRALFFVIEDMVNYFDLLQYGLCLILVFIGLQLIFAPYLQLPASSLCVLIGAVFVVCILGSRIKHRGEECPAVSEG